MKLLKEELENLQSVKDYNYAHSATRGSVENAIGRLKLKLGRIKMIRCRETAWAYKATGRNYRYNQAGGHYQMAERLIH